MNFSFQVIDFFFTRSAIKMMRHGVRGISLSLFSIIGFSTLSVGQANMEDSLALVALYESTNGDGWTNNENWLEGPVESWFGITVVGNRVEMVQLHNSEECCVWNGNNLTGEIPEEIGNLSHLRLLNLSENNLSGSLPDEIGNLDSLELLSLYNGFTGDGLSGEIPDSYEHLKKLTSLSIVRHQLSGSLPNWIGNLENLSTLDLSENRISGSIPNTVGNLTQLTMLRLAGNQLAGNIPTEITNLAALRTFDVHHNLLDGSIPPTINKLEKLEALNLSRNRLSGRIVKEIGDLNELRSLWLYSNRLTGNIPSEIGDLPELRILNISGNQLTGSVPLALTNSKSLDVFDISDNFELCEPQSNEFTNWKNSLSFYRASNLDCPELNLQSDSLALVALYESANGDLWLNNSNWLITDIETWYGISLNADFRVSSLHLSHNGLSGTLTSEIGRLTSLRTLSLDSSDLSGSIPLEIIDLVLLGEGPDDLFSFGNTNFL